MPSVSTAVTLPPSPPRPTASTMFQYPVQRQMLPWSADLDLVLGRARVLREQGGRAHQHPRRAVAALERVVVGERLLQRRQLVVARVPRRSSPARRRAWTASTAQLFTATPSRWTVQAPQLPVSQPMCVPGEVEVVAEEVDEQAARGDLALVRRAVDRRRSRAARVGVAVTLILSLSRPPPGRRGRPTSPRGCAGSRPTRARPTGGSSVAPSPSTAARTAPRRRRPRERLLDRRRAKRHRGDAPERRSATTRRPTDAAAFAM